MSEVFLEVIINAEDANSVGIESRDEIEDALEEMLSDGGLAELTGGGGGMGLYVLDLEASQENFEEALQLIKQSLRSLRVPQSTRIKRRLPTLVEFSVYD